MKNNFDPRKLPDEEQLFLEIFRGKTYSIEILGGSVGMSNSDQKCRPFITCSDIIHPGFYQKGKPVEPRTRPSKGTPRRKIRKKVINS